MARPSISSFVSLGGGFTELPNPLPLLQAIPCPELFMWGEDLAFENLDPGGVWDRIAQPKTSAAFPGEHFDLSAAPARMQRAARRLRPH